MKLLRPDERNACNRTEETPATGQKAHIPGRVFIFEGITELDFDMAVRKVLRKLNKKAGFSLGETLIAVAILVILSVAALPTAMKAYQNAIDAANAQVLFSTTVNALRGELSTAWNVRVREDGTTITYNSANTGDESVIYIDDEHELIMLREYSQEDTPSWWGDPVRPTAAPRPLMTDAMRQTTRNNQEHMKVFYTGCTCSGTYVTITGLQVKRGDVVLAKAPDSGLLIRVMSTESTNPAAGG